MTPIEEGAGGDGGPAFPTENEHQSGANTYHYSGMTLRDYFIAHAPAEPQPWFSPAMPQAEAPLPHFHQMYPDCTEKEKAALNHYDADYMSAEDVLEERVRDYLIQKRHEAQRWRERGAIAERERFVQWPAAWADAMLKARKATGSPR